jgi:hypothetical protein
VINIEELESYDDKEQQGDTKDKKAKKIKFCFIRLLSQIHNIVIYIRGLTAQIAEFLELVSKIILLDNRIR